MGRQRNPNPRKRDGVYYTPAPLVDYVVAHTLGPLLVGRTAETAARLRVIDPACGDGAFLVGAYRYLLAWHGVLAGRHIASNNLFGMELDPDAAEIARLRLRQLSGDEPDVADALERNIQTGNALLGIDGGSFDAVIGNPPWGQKAIVKDTSLKRTLWARFPSSAGIFDLFRPFVELSVRLTAPGGRCGLVLPDTVLLKDYPTTRRYLLDELALERIDWWGRAFADATIDTATIVGRKEKASADHAVRVEVHGDAPLVHAIPQADFRANPRHVFNLHLIPGVRAILQRCDHYPRLGDCFEVHEGVHSGNMRAELFVPSKLDDSCRELLFGRDEMVPYQLRWGGGYVRLNALLERKSPARYANLGQPKWHEQAKLLVRRTGDRVIAAVDRDGRYASNNFFVVFPRNPPMLDLDGLCALLNSEFMTWYFRAVEPRKGRAFAELKIKHLAAFPLPPADAWPELNDLGRRRAAGEALDTEIDRRVRAWFGAAESALASSPFP